MKKVLSVLMSVLMLALCAVPVFADCAHDYAVTYHPPTCTEKGYNEFVCKLCGQTVQEGIVPEKGHAYGEWVLVSLATCSATGLEKRVCTVCGGVETNILEMSDHKDADEDYFCDDCGFELKQDEEEKLSPYEWLKLFFANLIAWIKAIFA